MIDWIRQNKAGVTVIVVAVALLTAGFIVQGCSVYDVVKMPVTTSVQQATGSAPVIPISEYPDLRREYVEKTARELEKNDAKYTKSLFWADLLAMGVNFGVQLAQAEAATIPGGALLVTALGTVGGLMLRKPGDGKKIEGLNDKLAQDAKDAIQKLMDEKLASFNKCLKEGRAG